MGPSPTVSSSRAKVAGLTLGVRTGKRQSNDPALVDAYRSLAEAKIANYITRVLAEAPDLTDKQLTDLSELLRPARTRAGGAP